MSSTKKINLGTIDYYIISIMLNDLDFVKTASIKDTLNCYFKLDYDEDTNEAVLETNQDGIEALRNYRTMILPELWNL